MLQLKNTSPFEPTIAVFPNKDGVDTLYLIIKGTFQISQSLAVADVQVPPVMTDEYWGDPESSSLKYASDMHLCKPSTDVVLVGQAWALDAGKAQQVDVTLAVADRHKTVRVFGDRVWQKSLLGVTASQPEPFQSIPIVYERAYGGVHIVDAEKQKVLAEDRNPVGVGFLGKRKAKEMIGQPLPNIEDPKKLIRGTSDQPTPAGFGFTAPAWLPRRAFAGTYDEAWQKSRAPYLPKDFDPRFFNAAHSDLVFDRYLQGGESVEVINASPNGPLRFNLPQCALETTVKIDGETQPLEPNLETVLIEPDDDRLCLVWRAEAPCDKKMLKVEEVTVGMQNMKRDGGAS